MNGLLSYRRRSLRVCLGFLVASSVVSGCADTLTYAGKLQPLAGTCDADGRATMQRHGTVIQFAPKDGVLVLDGTVASNGQITAAQQTLGMDKKPYRLTFTGQLSGSMVTGTYVTPRCRYQATLNAVE